jgi:hypothetical protein|tara:strand:+ start:63 stop:500 length:438 start_codon:yes stop_codon:yes gene_type:complete
MLMTLMKNFLGILSLFFLMSGCYQASLAPMLGPAATASQGNLAYSAASTGLSYGVKHQTGKFPVEHIFQREKQKIVKKIDLIETKIKDKSNSVRANIIDRKNNLQSKAVKEKTRWVLHLKDIKNVKEKDAFPASRPRNSYWSKAK